MTTMCNNPLTLEALHSAHTYYLHASNDSCSKEGLFAQTVLADWFL